MIEQLSLVFSGWVDDLVNTRSNLYYNVITRGS